MRHKLNLCLRSTQRPSEVQSHDPGFQHLRSSSVLTLIVNQRLPYSVNYFKSCIWGKGNRQEDVATLLMGFVDTCRALEASCLHQPYICSSVTPIPVEHRV